ncbi:MAG TPA: ABC transporter permease [Blastocatellia bacterium]|nr:ABC transporter permease [Blastocatellia bacterium]HMX24986.1 ABC transporter permease [Blastocatellia bacterium]HNG31381.1 ABC transporter permease [Blastocatellia bacterium]
MEFKETLKLAFDAIWSHKLRSALTLLGMIIGVTAVVIIVSLIQGFNRYVDEKIAGIGAKAFSVRRFSFEDWKNTDTIAEAQRRNKDLTMDEFDYLYERATLVDKLGAKAMATPSTLKRGNESAESVRVDGTTANCVEIDNLDIAEGRYFTTTEDTSTQNVVFLGADVASKLFPNSSPIGQEITIRGLPYRVVGVAAAKGTVFGMPQDIFATIPLRTYVKNFGPAVRQRSLYFTGTAKNDDQFQETVEEVRALLRARRGLSYGEKDNFGIGTPDAIMEMRDKLLGPIFIAAVAVPGIALVVGGIVIMNIMLVSVTERTKEIGIRKSLGARRADILKQFLIEAVTLSAIGGATGVFIAWVFGRVLTAVFFPTYLSIAAVIIAVSVSGLIGVLSGLLPASKASRLDPIEALRAD